MSAAASSNNNNNQLAAELQGLSFEQQQQLLQETPLPSSVADFTLKQPYEGPRDAAGRYHGRCGKIILKGDITYTGDFFHGRKHGIGIQTWPDGSSFCGEWVHGEAHGFGKLTLPSGSEYFGEVTGGVRNGLGVFRSADGSRYFGSWKNGKRDGFGIEIGEDGTYTGEWKDNSHHGWGTIQFGASLNRYTGEWNEDVMEGVGSMVWVTLKDQNRAKKLWRRASSKMLLGLAAERERQSSSSHHQQHNNNKNQTQNNNNNESSTKKMSRRGSMIKLGGVSAQSLMLSSDDMQQYVGEWSQGCPHGNGELRRILLSSSSSNNNNKNSKGGSSSNHRSVPFEMGNHFQGSFKNGKRDGFGIQYFADGSAFEGTWQRNLKHGQGTIIRSDGALVHVALHNDTIISEKTVQQEQQEREKELQQFLNFSSDSAGGLSAATSTSLDQTQRMNQTSGTASRKKQSQNRQQQDDGSVTSEQQQDGHSTTNNNNNANNSTTTNPGSSAPTTHVDISIKDLCFSKADGRAVHITISLVFVALRHLFHVYVGMQSGCGNFDDIYAAQIHSKLPEGIQLRSKVKTPAFVSVMSEDVLRSTPIHHLSDFEGIVQLAEAHAETTLLHAAKAAQKAMRLVMIHDHRIRKYSRVNQANSNSNNNDTRKRSTSPLSAGIAAASSHHNKNHVPAALDPSLHDEGALSSASPPLSPLSAGHQSPSHQDLMSKFLAWTDPNRDENDNSITDTNNFNSIHNDDSTTDEGIAAGLNRKTSTAAQTQIGAEDQSTITSSKSNHHLVDSDNDHNHDNDHKKQQHDHHNSDHDDDHHHDQNASIEELFGQYDGATNSASVSGTTSATGAAERRPLSTVMHLAGFLSLLRDAEALSPDMTALDVLDCLEPLLSRRAHVPGAPGLTWPAFVEAIVRVAHKKLALSAVFCAQDQGAQNSSLGSRLHHFVKEYLYPLLRCIKDLEACPEASAIIGVEQLEIATSENTTFDSIRKATLRQLRSMTSGSSSSSKGRHQQHQQQLNNNNEFGGLSRETSNSLFNDSAALAAVAHDSQFDDDSDRNTLSSGTNTPRSVSESSVFPFGANNNNNPSSTSSTTHHQHAAAAAAYAQQLQQNNQQQLPATFEEAILLLAKQVEETISVKKQLSVISSSSSTTNTRNSSSSSYYNNQQQQQPTASSVARGMELLQALCAGSWSQFPAVAQCEVIEKVRIQATEPANDINDNVDLINNNTIEDSNQHHSKHSSSRNHVVSSSDFVEVWCVASRPHKHSQQIRLHLLLVQIVKQTAEVRFVGFIPSSIIERLCVQSRRDPEFFKQLAKRTLFPAGEASSADAAISADEYQQQPLKKRRSSSCVSSSTKDLLARKSSGGALGSQRLSTVSQMTTGSRKSFSSASNNNITNSSEHQNQIIKDVSLVIAASSFHQLLRGSRFFSTVPLVHFDSLKQLYHSCDRSLGPLVAACTFSGLFLYPGQKKATTTAPGMNKKNSKKNSSDNNNKSNNSNNNIIEPFPVSSVDVLRHCIHSLYGIDPVTSTGGLFIDIKSNYTGYLSAGRKSISGAAHARRRNSLDDNLNSNNAANSSNNNNNAIVDNTDVLISPDEAASVVMQALQTLSVKTSSSNVSSSHQNQHRKSTVVVSTPNDESLSQQQISNTGNNKSTTIKKQNASANLQQLQQNTQRKFGEIAEAAKARAQQAIKSEEQRLVYHGDNWRAREQNKKQKGFEQLSSWPLAASDLKLSFGEFVECIMMICGLCSKLTKEKENIDENTSCSGDKEKRRNSTNTTTAEDINNAKNEQQQQPRDETDALAMTMSESNIMSRSVIMRQEKEMDSALRGVMRASRAKVGARFDNADGSNNNTTDDSSASNSHHLQNASITSTVAPTSQQQQQVGRSSFSSTSAPTTTKNISCSTFLLDDFFKNFLPTIQYFVEVRNALPSLVPSYWSWAIVDSFKNASSSSRSSSSSKQDQQQQQPSFVDEQLRTNFVSLSLKKRAVSAGLHATSNRNDFLRQVQQQQQKTQQQQQCRKELDESAKMNFMGRPLSPISFLHDDNKRDNTTNNQTGNKKQQHQQHITGSTTTTTVLPPYTKKETIERQQTLQKNIEIVKTDSKKVGDWNADPSLLLSPNSNNNNKDDPFTSTTRNRSNESSVRRHSSANNKRSSSSSSRRRSSSPNFSPLLQESSNQASSIEAAVPLQTYGLDDEKVAAILDKIDAQKNKEKDVVDKLHTFYNKRHDEALRIKEEREEQMRLAEEEEEQRLAALSTSRKRGGATSASRRAHSTPNSPGSRSSPRSPMSSSRRGTPTPSSAAASTTHPHNKNEPTRGQLLLSSKKKKGYESPQMAMVFKKITIGSSSVDGSSGKMVQTVQNELCNEVAKTKQQELDIAKKEDRFYTDPKNGQKFKLIDGGRKLLDDHRETEGFYYDERLNRHVVHPSSLQEAIKKGLLLETPPVSFRTKKIEEEVVKVEDSGENNNSKKGGKGASPKKMGASSRRKSVSPLGNKSVRK